MNILLSGLKMTRPVMVSFDNLKNQLMNDHVNDHVSAWYHPKTVPSSFVMVVAPSVEGPGDILGGQV